MEHGITQENEACVYEVEMDKPHPSSNHSKFREVLQWSNGQCVLAVPSSSKLSPRFDVSLCRALLGRDGFQIPQEDFQIPLQEALDSPSVRRYLFFSSSVFQFFLAPVVYMVVWCCLYSSVHLYLRLDVRAFWLFCGLVSLAGIIITAVIILIFNNSSKKININTDIRLIQVNERLLKYKLLAGLDDSEHRFTGTLQLYFLYWDLTPCLARLSEALATRAEAQLQNKLQRSMSHLRLVVDMPDHDLEARAMQDGGSEETRPLLLGSQSRGCRTENRQREALTKSYSLVPDRSLSAQAKAYQLLLTYSAAYVKLMMSGRLPGPTGSSERPLQSERSHCSVATICLCQYIQHNILR